MSEEDGQSELSKNGEIVHLSIKNLSSFNVSDIDEEIEDASLSVFIFRNKKENWSASSHVSNTGRSATCNIFRERTGLSCCAKTLCDATLDSSKLFFPNKWLKKVCN